MIRVFLLLLLAACAAIAEDSMLVDEYQLTPVEKVLVQHPKQLRYDVTKDPDDMFRPGLRLRAFDTNSISALSFKIFPGTDEGNHLANQKEVDETLQKISARYVDGSVEKNNSPQHLRTRNGLGSYCTLTDAELVGTTKLPPGQFRYLTFAVIKVGQCVFTVRGYSNSKDGADFKAMLSVLEQLSVEKQPASEKPKGNL